MADMEPIHPVPRGIGWANVRGGSDRPISTASTRAEAQAAGRRQAISDQVEHVIHNKDSKIGEKNSYGNDPRNVKG
ncbi:MAG TPA: DUF2188 domain-containing protein [Gemmatimonadales bacterium]|nr:DUF2188 domain-containing protein [Gemmatimonadales bacterium]